MYEWQNFDVVFQAKLDCSYDEKNANAILKSRKELAGTLFFDRVWSNLGLKDATKAYPPRTNHDLRNLWQTIVKSTAPDYQKQATLYYILLDCRQMTNAEGRFASKVWLPRKYSLLIQGLWYLDRCYFPQALERLTDPSLTPTFTDEILYTLIHHPRCDNSLAMAYYITVSPPLQDERTLAAYFSMLRQNSVAEAYNFAKRQNVVRHKSLFEDLVVVILSEGAGEARADRALTLLSLPFTSEEEDWFEECLLYGKGNSCNQARDSVLMRRIALGKDYDGLGALDRLRGHKVNGINWDDVRISMQKTDVS